MNVSVVILNYNGRQHLETYLPSVVQHSKGHKIIIVDNLSTDDSVQFLEQNYPDIQIIINKENGGFAKGYNDGLKQIDSDLYVLLNSDIEVTSGWIEHIIPYFEKNDTLGACQPKILSYKEKHKFEHAGACGGFIDKNGYPFCRGRIFENAEEDLGQYDDATQVFWATGAAMFIRSKVFHEMDGFDATFFAHMEEIDLCWRMQRAGYKIASIPNSVVYHLGGGTLAYMNPKKTFLNFRNNLFMLHKNYQGFLFGKILHRLILDGLAAVKFLFDGHFKHSLAILKAHFHYYKNIGSLSKKRKSLKKYNHDVFGVYSKAISWQYYFKKQIKFSQLDKLVDLEKTID